MSGYVFRKRQTNSFMVGSSFSLVAPENSSFYKTRRLTTENKLKKKKKEGWRAFDFTLHWRTRQRGNIRKAWSFCTATTWLRSQLLRAGLLHCARRPERKRTFYLLHHFGCWHLTNAHKNRWKWVQTVGQSFLTLFPHLLFTVKTSAVYTVVYLVLLIQHYYVSIFLCY